MLKARKGHIMRHPYLTLAVLGLAVTGAVTITNRAKYFFMDKGRCVSNMVKGMKSEENM